MQPVHGREDGSGHHRQFGISDSQDVSRIGPPGAGGSDMRGSGECRARFLRNVTTALSNERWDGVCCLLSKDLGLAGRMVKDLKTSVPT